MSAEPLSAGFAISWFQALAPAALEAAVLGIVVWIVVRLGHRAPSSWRYGLLTLALLKFLLPPLPAPWTTAIELPLASNPPIVAKRLQPAFELPFKLAPSAGATTTESALELLPPSLVGLGATPHSRSVSSAALPSATVDRSPPPQSLAARLLVLQLLGAGLLLAARARQALALRRVVRRTYPVHDPALVGLVRQACTSQGLRRAPALLASRDGVGPAAAGLWRRRIILPAAIIEQVPAARLRPVIAHEVAHHRRHDLWIETLAFCGTLVWWAHPIYWLLRRELRQVGEDCCDDMAVVEAGGPYSYCQSLLDAATALAGHRPPLPAVAHGSFSHPLGRRIRRIMNPSTRPSPRLSSAALTSLLVLAALVVPSAYTFGAPTSAANPQLGIFSRGRNVSLGVDDGIIEISAGAIAELVDRGIDESFLEQLDGSENRVVTLDELRQWARYGVDATLADELEALAIRQLRVMDVLRLVWSDADGAYVRSLRESGIPGLGLDEILRLARYEVTGQYIGDFREQGYLETDTDDLVQLRRYEVEPAYAGTYKEAGYDLSVEDLVQLHRYQVDENEVARLAAVGLDDISVTDLVTLKRYDIDDTYIREMTVDGDVDVSVEELVTLSRYDVTPSYAARMREAGIEASTEDLVTLKRYSVDPELVLRYTELGQSDIGVEGLVRLQRYDVDPEYVVGLRQLGYNSPTVDDLVTLQRYEVDLDRITALAEAGYASLPISELVELQRYQVSAAFIRALGATVSRHLSVKELVTLRRYEVTAEYVAALEAAGFGDLGVDDIVRLKRHEVDPEFIERLKLAGFDDLTIDKIIRLKRADR